MRTTYFANLLQYLPQEERQQLQQAFGASEAQIQALLEVFPNCPQALVELLQDVNGTYYCQHGQETICVLVLGSDLGDYPYYLKSVEQIVKDYHDKRETIYERYQEFLAYVEVDEKINMHVPLNERLCFADCMNNGAHQAYILILRQMKRDKLARWFVMSMILIALR